MYDIFVMEFPNYNIQKPDLFSMSGIPMNYKTTRYFGSHLETITRCVEKATTEYIWIISDICDYHMFDFNYRPAPWEANQIHCWASGEQQQGDTFLVPVQAFKDQYGIERLEYFHDINYHYPGVRRYPMPVINYENNLIEYIKNSADSVYTMFTLPLVFTETILTPSLWKERAIYPLNKSGSAIMVPGVCKQHISEQLYDYPHISYDHTHLVHDKPQDVVFISNGEINADLNYKVLQQQCKTLPNRVLRSDGIDGREKAYKAAANLSETPWFYAVFAKTEVLPSFMFDLQPDYLQQPKHYILHSRNPLNGLEYGSMNINLYNKQLVLDTQPGIDFTLSAEHTVIPICASISRFNIDPWITWRSAFREVIKLTQEINAVEVPEIETEYRLHRWMTVAEGLNADWCLQGSADGIKYYHRVKGDPVKLQQTFDWPWLKAYFEARYKSVKEPIMY